MGKKAAKNQFEEALNETLESFDLGDFLRGRSVRTKTVRVFTDEVTAERRGGFEKTTDILPNGVEVPALRSWGLVKDLAEAQEEYSNVKTKSSAAGKALKSKIDTITEEIKALTATLLETSLQIELKAIPKVVKRDAYRATKKALGINGKINDSLAMEFIDEHNAQLLTRTVVSITRGDGEKNLGLSIESARNLVDLLPDSEWDKVAATIRELLELKVIADQVVEQRDF